CERPAAPAAGQPGGMRCHARWQHRRWRGSPAPPDGHRHPTSTNDHAQTMNGASMLSPTRRTTHALLGVLAAVSAMAAASNALAVGTIATTTTLTSSANPVVVGQEVIYTASVRSGSKVQPTGTVTFKSGSTAIANCGSQALSGGIATCVVAGYTQSGSFSITASYGGDTVSAASASAALTEKVNPSPTSGS